MTRSLMLACTGAAVFCLTGLVFFVSMILSMHGLGPIDDHHFVHTLFQGKPFGAYLAPELGRFIPLTGQEYALAAIFFKPTPLLFYLISALKVFLAGALLFYCLLLTKARNWVIVILWSAVVLSIGFANAALRLQIGELNALVLTLIFIGSMLTLENAVADQSGKGRVTVAIGILALSTALFYKEVIFVFMVGFASCEITRKYRQEKNAIPAHLWVLLGIGLAYLVGYALWRAIYVTGSYTSFHSTSFGDALSYYQKNDPWMVWVVFPLALLRLVKCLRDAAAHTVFDSFLMSALAYCAAYVVLGMCNTYYLLPAYGFAVCGVAGLLAVQFTARVRSLILLCIGLFTINNAPIAIAEMQRLKLIANNHYQFVQALAQWINAHPLPDASHRNLILPGVSSGSGIEILVSLKRFLIAFATPASTFAVKAAVLSNNQLISQFYGYSAQGYAPMPGDVLIFNPYQQVAIYPALQAPSSQEIYRSQQQWSSPRWTTLDWLEQCLVEQAGCAGQLAHRRYVGYTAMLMTRTPAPIANLHPLKTPMVQLSDLALPSQLPARSVLSVDVTLRNSGTETWPADGQLHPGMFVNLAYQWFDQNGQVILEGDRAPFPEPMQPNDSAKITLLLKTPKLPGKYTLMIAPVQEGVRWFNSVERREFQIN